MKKILIIGLSLVFTMCAMSSCFGSDDDSSSNYSSSNMDSSSTLSSSEVSGMYRDGTYTAEVKNEMDGYKDYVTITVKNDKITDIDFNSKDKNGKLITDDTDYKDKMVSSGSTTYPEKYYKEYADAYMNNNDFEGMDIIEGAENTFNNFKELVGGALNNAKNGIEDIFYYDNKID